MLYTKRLIDLRIEKNLKQYELADLLNLAPSTYSNYESEYEIMSTKHLNTLCNYFNVSFDYIFEFTGIRNYSYNFGDLDLKKSGNRLRKLRNSKNLSQFDLANILKISQSTISTYECGKEIIPLQFLYVLCGKYNVSADYLLGKSNALHIKDNS